jgi:hypothetical protein
MPKPGIGHVPLLIVAGWLAALIAQALDEAPGARKFCATVLCILGIWTLTSLVAAFGYVASRKLLSR